MINLQILSPTEQEELKELRVLAGWQHITEPIKTSIRLKRSALLFFVFDRDKEGRVTNESLLKYENIQRELVLLEEFFAYLNDDVIIEEKTSGEVFQLREGE